MQQPYPEVRLSTLALYAGLIVGATFWGMSCDVIGRRLAWNCTLFLSGVFGFSLIDGRTLGDAFSFAVTIALGASTFDASAFFISLCIERRQEKKKRGHLL